MAKYYTLPEILRVASKHPFYSPQAHYPPTLSEVDQVACDESVIHKGWLWSTKLTIPRYQVISRLLVEENPANDFRKDSYISQTGGGSGGRPIIFLTDNKENRNQRSLMGQLIKDMKIIEPGDWVVTIHTAGNMYRSLDLTSEIVENAGACVISAGQQAQMPQILEYIDDYRANVLSGDSTQILLFARYVESLGLIKRNAASINKIIYTSEPLILSQRRYLRSVFGPIQIHSFLASAEAGPWTVANLSLTGDTDADYADFIYDTRSMIVEIIKAPAHVGNTDQEHKDARLEQDPADKKGAVILTSLSRLRNPLVRYDTGDLGSVHDLPPQAINQLGPDIVPFLKIFRIHGRDQKSSFSFMAEYFDLVDLENIFNNAEYPVLKWQVILIPASGEHIDDLEIRLLSSLTLAETGPRKSFILSLRHYFRWDESYEGHFHINFVNETSDFIRSSTGNKVIRFVRRERELHV